MNLFLFLITLSLCMAINKGSPVTANNNIRKNKSAFAGRSVNRTVEQNSIPSEVCSNNCVAWFDGCNTCKCSGDGTKVEWCTEIFCPNSGEAYCLHNYSPEKNCIMWYDGCNTCNEMGCTEKFCPYHGDAYCLDYVNPHGSKDSECVKYGDIVHFQMSNINGMWLASDGLIEQVSIITQHFNQREVSAYEWTIRSGNDENESDPRAGECVYYQDKVYIQVNNVDNMWLTGGRGRKSRKVAIRDHFSKTESKNQLVYSWTLRSNTTDNYRKINDSRTGDDVRYDGDIFLQIDYVHNRWLTGGLGIDGSMVRTIGYTYTNKWTVRKSNSLLI